MCDVTFKELNEGAGAVYYGGSRERCRARVEAQEEEKPSRWEFEGGRRTAEATGQGAGTPTSSPALEQHVMKAHLTTRLLHLQVNPRNSHRLHPHKDPSCHHPP